MTTQDKPQLILLGGGGHCAACIDVIEQENRYDIAGIVDVGNAAVCGYPVLGNDEALVRLRAGIGYALVTVGQIDSPAIRIRLYELAASLGFEQPTIVSPRAYVSKHARLGRGSIIMHNALINARAVVGDNCIINSGALIEHDAVIANHCHISTAAVINGGTTIQSGTFVGSNAIAIEQVKSAPNDFIRAGTVFKGTP